MVAGSNLVIKGFGSVRIRTATRSTELRKRGKRDILQRENEETVTRQSSTRSRLDGDGSSSTWS